MDPNCLHLWAACPVGWHGRVPVEDLAKKQENNWGRNSGLVNCCTQLEMSLGVPVALWEAGNPRNVHLRLIKFTSKKQHIRIC